VTASSGPGVPGSVVGPEGRRGMLLNELQPGAENAIRICLNVQPHERVTVITDRETRDIADALVDEIRRVGAPSSLFVLEDEAMRPLTDLPASVAADMELSQVSIFAAQAQANELPSRMQMTDIVNRRRMRHAHMVNINRQIMLEGMRADFHVVDAISTRVIDRVRKAKQISRPAATSRRISIQTTGGSRPAASSVPTNGATSLAAKCSPVRARSTAHS